jgi:hypothetical protein
VTVTPTATPKEQHRDELVDALAAAASALAKAEQAAGVWADDASAAVEEGPGPVGPSDPERVTDPIYVRTLNVLSKIRAARAFVETIQVP